MARKKSDFVNHHMHSFFSSLDGMPSPVDIMNRIVDLGQRSFSITDHGSLSAVPAAYEAAREAGVGFTPGIEAYFTKDRFNKTRDVYGKDYYHMIMLAYNNTGYHNLVKMQTPSWSEGQKGKYPRLDYEILEKYHEGITVTTACLGGIVAQHILHGHPEKAEEELGTLVDIFGKDNVYIEVQNHHQHDDKVVLPYLLEMHKKTGVKLLATSDSHYCLPGDYEAHDALLATGTKKKKHDEGRFKFVNDEFYIPSQERMEEILPPRDFPGAISNTVELAEKTDFHLKMGKEKTYLMPHIEVLPGMTESETLRSRVMDGARDPKRYGDGHGNIPDEIQERIDYELGVIDTMGFAGYFLIVSDMIKDFAKHGIKAGPGRGCLDPSTLILTRDRGYVTIDTITNMDTIMSGDGKWQPVKQLLRHETVEGEKLIKIVLTTGDRIVCTQKHKILVRTPGDAAPQWKKAYTITTTDTVTAVYGDTMTDTTIAYIDYVDAPHYVYDLTVATGDPSFLTSGGTVHNSAPGSIVVYCAGITDVDPIEHNLFFERFLNPDRISMPDIDVDVPKSKRGAALKLMEDRYGKGHVAHLANYNKMGVKDALNRVAKVYSVPVALTEYVDTYMETNGLNLKDMAQRGIPAEIAGRKEFRHTDVDTLNTVLDVASRLEGTLSSYGVHASGIVVTSTLIDDNFPIRLSNRADLPVSQYDGHDVENLGGVKIDILGLVNLDQCEDAERNIRLDCGDDVDSSRVPKDDPKVYDMLTHGDGGGVFQLGCLAGDTIVDGVTIKYLYQVRNSESRHDTIPSVFLGHGMIDDNQVDNVVYSGKKEVFTVTTCSGKKIRATKDHKIFTNSGWKTVAELRIGTPVVTVDDETVYRRGRAVKNRGTDDVLAMFEQLHSTPLVRMNRDVVTSGYHQFMPDYREAYPNHNHYYVVVNDHGLDGSMERARRITDDPSLYTLTTYTYSDIVERYVERHEPQPEDFLLPVGATWDYIESISETGAVEDTYDIMMRAPVNNFIADGFMVHNSSGMQSLMRTLRPETFNVICVLIALFRPGPLGMGTHVEYAHRKNDGAPQAVLHPDMEKVLKDNYNLIVYQEDIMAIARTMAGYTGGEADTLRKAIAKKNPVMIQQQAEKFIPAINKNYYDGLGEALWDIIAPFGKYAFNKSHSVAYGFTTYRTAWLKAHYPAQFAGAVIDNVLDKPDELLKNFVWMKAMGLDIHTPDINMSQIRSVTGDNMIQLPLHLVKGVGEDMAKRIIDERDTGGEYTSVTDFVARNSINVRDVTILAKAGCFDSLSVNRAAVVYNAPMIVSAAKQQAGKATMESGLFGNFVADTAVNDDKWVSDDAAPDTFVENGVLYNTDITLYALWEKEAMGVLVGKHPFSVLYEHVFGTKLVSTYPPVTDFRHETRDMKAVAYITDITNRVYTDKRGTKKMMSRFNLETDEGSVPGVIFDQMPDTIHDNSFVYVEGNLKNNNTSDSGDFVPDVIVYTMKPLKMEKIMSSEVIEPSRNRRRSRA